MSQPSANSALLSTQRFLQTALIGAPDDVSLQQIRAVIAPSQRLTPEQRLAIYRDGYFARLLECMSAMFPVLRAKLGTGSFDELALEYLQVCPSQSYHLSKLGLRFPAYLRQTRPEIDAPEAQREGWIDFMIDLAELELALFCLFDMQGREDAVIDDAQIADSRLLLQPALSLHAYRYPVADHYHLGDADEAVQFPSPQASHVALVRHRYRTGIYPLTALQYRFLQIVAREKSIMRSLAGFAAREGLTRDNAAALWQEWRAAWVAGGFFMVHT
jgi:hypothetical protein